MGLILEARNVHTHFGSVVGAILFEGRRATVLGRTSQIPSSHYKVYMMINMEIESSSEAV